MTTNITELASHMRGLAEAATPGPWYVQYGDDDNHMCMTAIGTENKRERNDGQFSQEEADKFVAITLHQLYPWVNADCTNDDANSAYIAAANPAKVITILDALEAAQAEVARLREKESSLDRMLALFKEVQAVADERDAALARLAEIDGGTK